MKTQNRVGDNRRKHLITLLNNFWKSFAMAIEELGCINVVTNYIVDNDVPVRSQVVASAIHEAKERRDTASCRLQKT